MKLICSRKVDELGRIVLPQELRTAIGIESASTLDIFQDGDNIILKKHNPSCAICNANDVKLTEVKGKFICADCVSLIK